MSTSDSFWPYSDDSIEVLQEKKDLNINAAWGEICIDTVCPDRESEVTEYQSNAIISQELIDQKETDNSTNKTVIYESDDQDESDDKDELKNRGKADDKDEFDNRGCIQPQPLQPQHLVYFDKFFKMMGIGGILYGCLKVLELPLLSNPATAPIYITH